ncbi:MAG TPA: hypothetical protein VH678_05815 [Xanthobacteraceae bacterium]
MSSGKSYSSSLDDAQMMGDRQYFELLSHDRARWERWRIWFRDRATRTSLRRRRWFQISEIEPDSAARALLIRLWRASIYSGDLEVGGKSQVLCLSATPLLAGWRLPCELARGEQFNVIVGDLWMSAPRWVEWLRQIRGVQPQWLCETAELSQRRTAEARLAPGGQTARASQEAANDRPQTRRVTSTLAKEFARKYVDEMQAKGQHPTQSGEHGILEAARSDGLTEGRQFLRDALKEIVGTPKRGRPEKASRKK